VSRENKDLIESLDGREGNSLSATAVTEDEEFTVEITASRFESGVFVSVSVELTPRQAQRLADALTAGLALLR
jgi:hypothetical protein